MILSILSMDLGLQLVRNGNIKDCGQIENMKIKTNRWLKPGFSRQYDWSAIDQDTYDGGSNRNEIGYGATELEAIADLLRLKIWDKYEESILNGA